MAHQTFPARYAITLGGARDGCPSAPKKVIMEWHIDWGHAKARHPNRVFVYSDWGNTHLANYVDVALGHCEVRRAFDKAPHVPIAGTSKVSTLNGKLQEQILFLGEVIALRATDVRAKYPLLIPAHSGAPNKFGTPSVVNGWGSSGNIREF